MDSDVLIYAVGRLNNYKMPTLDGQSLFRGRIVHTATWPDDLDVNSKRVVIVGNGASAVQCVPALQPGREPVPSLLKAHHHLNKLV